jgi:GTP-binding protein
MEKMNHRKGVYLESKNIPGDKVAMEFLCTTRGSIGLRSELLSETQGSTVIRSHFHEYQPYSGAIKKNPKGAMICMIEGVTTPYSLK